MTNEIIYLKDIISKLLTWRSYWSRNIEFLKEKAPQLTPGNYKLRIEIATEQEKAMLKALSRIGWGWTKDLPEWTINFDLCNGDFYYKDFFTDIKIGELKYIYTDYTQIKFVGYTGAITKRSLESFALAKHFYICFDAFGTRAYLIDSEYLLKLVREGKLNYRKTKIINQDTGKEEIHEFLGELDYKKFVDNEHIIYIQGSLQNN